MSNLFQVIGVRHIPCYFPVKGVIEVKISNPNPAHVTWAILDVHHLCLNLYIKGEMANGGDLLLDYQGMKGALARAGFPVPPTPAEHYLSTTPPTPEQLAADEAAYTEYTDILSQVAIESPAQEPLLSKYIGLSLRLRAEAKKKARANPSLIRRQPLWSPEFFSGRMAITKTPDGNK